MKVLVESGQPLLRLSFLIGVCETMLSSFQLSLFYFQGGPHFRNPRLTLIQPGVKWAVAARVILWYMKDVSVSSEVQSTIEAFVAGV